MGALAASTARRRGWKDLRPANAPGHSARNCSRRTRSTDPLERRGTARPQKDSPRLDSDRHEDRRPPRGQEQRVPGGDHPAGRSRTDAARATRSSSRHDRRYRLGITDTAFVGHRCARSSDRRRHLGGRRPGAQGQGAVARGVRPDARTGRCSSPTSISRRRASARRRCSSAGVTGVAYETVQLPDKDAAAAGPDERGGRAAGPAWWAPRLADGGPTAVGGVLIGGVPGVHAAKVVDHRRRRGRAATRRRSRSACRPRFCCSIATSPSCGRATRSTRGTAARCVEHLGDSRRRHRRRLVIGAVLVPARSAPKLVSNEQVSR